MIHIIFYLAVAYLGFKLGVEWVKMNTKTTYKFIATKGKRRYQMTDEENQNTTRYNWEHKVRSPNSRHKTRKKKK